MVGGILEGRAGVDPELAEAAGRVLGLTANGADRLLDAVKRELKVLDPSGFDCDDCHDTGRWWTPVARGAARLSSCHCPAARR